MENTSVLLTINGETIPYDKLKSYYIGVRDGQTIITVDYEIPQVKDAPPEQERSSRPGPNTQPIVPRSYIGKEVTPLTKEHMDVLQHTRAAREVQILDLDNVSEDEKNKRLEELKSFTPTPIEITTKGYEVKDWNDMVLLVNKLVQQEIGVAKKFQILVTAEGAENRPHAIVAGTTKQVQLTERLVGYSVKT
jgi:hypothetical protein